MIESMGGLRSALPVIGHNRDTVKRWIHSFGLGQELIEARKRIEQRKQDAIAHLRDGEVWGSWTIIAGSHRYKRLPCGDLQSYVDAQCTCGKVRAVPYHNLCQGLSKSCGCASRGRR